MGAKQGNGQAAPGHEAAGPPRSLRNRRPNPDVTPARVHVERERQEPVREERLRGPDVKLPERGSLIALATVQENHAQHLILLPDLKLKALSLRGQAPGSLIRPSAGNLCAVRPASRDPSPHLRPPGCRPDAVDQREEHYGPWQQGHNPRLRPPANGLAGPQELRQAVPEDFRQLLELKGPPAVSTSRHALSEAARNVAEHHPVQGPQEWAGRRPWGRAFDPSGDQSSLHLLASPSTTAPGSKVHFPSTVAAAGGSCASPRTQR